MRALVLGLLVMLGAACSDARAQDLGDDTMMRGGMSGKGDIQMPGGVAPVVCGDGVTAGAEGCDDDNTYDGDGCSASCAVETGWSCTGTPSTCTSADLVGGLASLAQQCTGSTLKTQAPNINVVLTRASSAWCTKSDGSMVLLTTDQPRREQLGLLVEPVSTGNGLTAPRDLTDAAWIKTNTTAAKTATGPDGVSNSASTLTATSSDGTVTQTVTVASSRRSSSLRIKRRTGTGAVYVTRDNFGAQTDISASLSSTEWKWVRSHCGQGDNTSSTQWWDVDFDVIPNCIAVSAMSSTAANPTIGVKLAVSGDAVDIDMVQDEASPFATSPQTGFTRAADVISDVGSTGSLPTTIGEASVDFTPEWYADGQSFNHIVINTSDFADADDGLYWYGAQADGLTYGRVENADVASSTSDGGIWFTGIGRNMRLTWGGDSWAMWMNGRPLVTTTGVTTAVPDSHDTYMIGVRTGAANSSNAGWYSRIKWSSAASFGAMNGSSLTVYTIGDSIVTGSPSAGYTPNTYDRPPTRLAGLIGAKLSRERYVYNAAIAGRTDALCASDAAGLTTEIVAGDSEAQSVFVVQCGVNSVAGDGSATWAVIQDLLEDAIAAGISVQPSTITPTSGTAAEDDFNALLLAWCDTNNIECADTYSLLESSPGSGALSNACNGGDGLHLNDTCSLTMATEWYRAGHVNGYW